MPAQSFSALPRKAQTAIGLDQPEPETRDQALSASARSHCSDRLDLEQPAGIERLCIIMVEAGSPPCSLRPRIARLAAVGRGGVHLHEMLDDAQAGGREHGIPTPVRIAPRSLRHDAVRTSRCLIADEQRSAWSLSCQAGEFNRHAERGGRRDDDGAFGRLIPNAVSRQGPPHLALRRYEHAV
jgi:hypothetical protein